jgi:TonB family protein
MDPDGTVATICVSLQLLIAVAFKRRIRDNGKVDQVQIQSSSRPDLNAEALELVSTWKFLPLLCNDAPATVDGDFVVHFQGR